MQSKRSFFNRAVFADTLRRFWPLWCLYPVMLYLLLPAQLTRFDELSVIRQFTGGRMLTERWHLLVLLTAVMAVITAMCVFGHLYSRQQTELMYSLPVRREAVYTSCLAAGFAPMLAGDVLIVLLTAVMELRRGALDLPILLLTLAILILLNLTFYGFAALCAMLTGSVVVLPLVFLALQVVEAVVEVMVNAILNSLVFGYAGSLIAARLSPLVWLIYNSPGTGPFPSWMDTFQPNTHVLAALAAYAAAGVVCAALGLLLHRRRAMESAGEVVAVPVLRPVFRWCMALGCGLVLGWVYCFLRGNDGIYYVNRLYLGRSAVPPLAICAALGCAAGWFGAEMLMKRTPRVFGKRSLWALMSVGVLLLFIIGAGMDITGFEDHVPAPEEVRAAGISVQSRSYQSTKAEDIRLVEAYHTLLIDGRSDYATAAKTAREIDVCDLSLHYVLENGRVLYRHYRIYDPASIPAMADDIASLEAAMDTDAAYDTKRLQLPFSEDTFLNCEIYYVNRTEGAEDIPSDLPAAESVDYRTLGAEQAAALYAAIEKDLDAHDICQFRIFREDPGLDTGISVYIELCEDKALWEPGRPYEGPMSIGSYGVTAASANTLAWLRDNLGIVPR